MNRLAVRLMRHVRANVIAYVALCCSLAGTSYAAMNLPANSVGAREIKNHSITPVKFNPKAIGGSVLAWARIDAHGNVIGSSGPVHVQHPSTSSDFLLRWRGKRFSPRCAAIATVAPDQPGGFGDAETLGDNGARIEEFTAQGQTGPTAVQPASIVVIC
jgi:hypothetical protein